MATVAFGLKVRKLLNVREQEQARVKWLFLHHFCQGLGIALFFLVANTLFLASYPVQKLPMVYGAAGLALLLVGRLYAYVEHHVPVHKLMPGVVLLLALSVVGARLGLMIWPAAQFAIALLVWHRVLYLLTSLEFWGVSALLMDVRQSKRLFGLISAGDIPAKLVGYLAVAALAPLGIENLLWLAAAAFLGSLFFLSRLLQETPLLPEEHPDEHHEHHHVSHWLQRIFLSPFVGVMAGLSFLVVMVSTFIDFAFLSEVQYQFTSQASLAYFLGLFFSLGKVVTLLTKLFFSGRLVERMGVRTSLLILPLLLLGFGLTVLIAQAIGTSHLGLLWIFGLMMLTTEVLRYSLHDPIFLALFQPLNRHLRLHGHTTVKGLIDPLALALAGGALFSLLYLQGRIDLKILNYSLLVLVAGWVLMVIYTNRVYLATVSQAIGRRFLEGSGLLLGGQHVLDLLQQRLKSERPEEVIYAMSLLEKAKSRQFTQSLPALFRHPAPVVQRYALERAEALSDVSLRAPVLELAKSNASPEVRAAALRTLASLGEDAAEDMLPFLEEQSLEVKKGAIVGLLRNGSIEGVVLAGQQLLALAETSLPTEKVAAAEIIGELRIRNFYQPIKRFIDEEQVLVKRSGLVAAGQIKNANLLPQLLPYLHERQWREEATEAFAQFGESGISLLSEQINSALDLSTEQLQHFCRVCARAGGESAQQLLLRLSRSEERLIRETAWQSLAVTGFQAIGEARNQLELQLSDLLGLWHYCLAAQTALSHHADHAQFHNAFYLESQQQQVPVFAILRLLFPNDAINKAEVGLASGQKEPMANALEMLEGLLPRPLSLRLLPFLEKVPLPERQRLLEPLFGVLNVTVEEVLTQVLKEGTNRYFSWTVAMALTTDTWHNTRSLREAAQLYAHHPNSLLREAYQFSAKKLLIPALADPYSPEPNEPAVSAHPHSQGLLQLEKVILLKSTPIFAETPENILVEVADIAHEVRVEAGHTIFRKGELGSNMYVIYEGRIRIHDGDHTFTEFHARDIFGELALLDPEPRSASATALTESLLLRLDQDAFSELMAERKEVAKGVFRVLCRRLRSQNELITQLRQNQPIAGA